MSDEHPTASRPDVLSGSPFSDKSLHCASLFAANEI